MQREAQRKRRRLTTQRVITLLVLVGASPWSARSQALQPLDVFVTNAQKAHPDVRASAATDAQRDAELDRATGTLLPSLQAQGNYTRNQYEVAFDPSLFGGGMAGGKEIVVQRYNQLDATFTASVPLIDVGAWERRAFAKATHEVSSAELNNVRFDLTRRVARAYFSLIANEAVLESAQRALELSQENSDLIRDRRDAGTASELDVQRARGDVARAQQDVAAANLNVVISRRSLETLSGLTPEPAQEFPADDLAAEAPLETWIGNGEKVPSVQSARAAKRAAERGIRAANAAWLPTVNGNFQERITNAPSLVGRQAYFLAQVSAVWRLDATIPANVRATKAQAEAAIAKADGTQRQAFDSIFHDWHQVNSTIERARSARTQVEAAQAAVQLARDRYEGGVATQLDVLQAQQDLFRADVGRIQADADLAYARAALRLDSGFTIGDRSR
jgi:outer membrane protein TolC